MALAMAPAPGKLGQGGSMEQSPHPEGFDDIADCCFVVRGVELRVHSQVILPFEMDSFVNPFSLCCPLGRIGHAHALSMPRQPTRVRAPILSEDSLIARAGCQTSTQIESISVCCNDIPSRGPACL